MPANKKYLAQSPWIKLGKLSAAILGGYIASLSLHMALAMWVDRKVVIPTAVYTTFLVWVTFMVIVYWVPRVWHAWALIGGIVGQRKGCSFGSLNRDDGQT